VGVVRIVELSNRVWQGGRLGVDPEFRRHNQIGKGLIWKAVTTAHGWGCDRFLATVQRQNVPFFRRLHWHSLEQLDIRGLPHQLMEADLTYYRPAQEPRPSFQALDPADLEALCLRLQRHPGLRGKNEIQAAARLFPLLPFPELGRRLLWAMTPPCCRGLAHPCCWLAKGWIPSS